MSERDADSKPRSVGPSVRPPLSLKERTSAELAEALRGLAAIRSAPAAVRPPESARMQRFIYGFGLPLRITRSLFADQHARKSFLRVILVQLALVLLIGTAAALLGKSGEAWRNGSHDFASILGIASAFYAGLGVVEWLIVALSRDYHDQLGRRASLLSGAPPEDQEATPRVRVDVRWLGRKLKRKLRGLLVIGAGLPIVFLTSLVPFAGRYLYPIVAFAWTTYWIGVFTASKSSFAWRSESLPHAPEPWFMRAADRATKETFVGRLGLPRLYVVVWRNISSGVFPPAREFEDHPYELLGIAAFRALLFIPGTYLFFRPILPVASAHVLCTPMGRVDREPDMDESTSQPALEASRHAAVDALGDAGLTEETAAAESREPAQHRQ